MNKSVLRVAAESGKRAIEYSKEIEPRFTIGETVLLHRTGTVCEVVGRNTFNMYQLSGFAPDVLFGAKDLRRIK